MGQFCALSDEGAVEKRFSSQKGQVDSVSRPRIAKQKRNRLESDFPIHAARFVPEASLLGVAIAASKVALFGNRQGERADGHRERWSIADRSATLKAEELKVFGAKAASQ